MKPIPFQHAKIGNFFQTAPKLGNPYSGDAFFQRVLQRLLPTQIFQQVHNDLERLGSRIESEIEELGVEAELNEPQLVQFDAWGHRVDKLITSSAWRRMKEISAEEGILSSGYSGKFGEFDRIFQFAKAMIFYPSSGLYSCPLAMTDGAAKILRGFSSKEFAGIVNRLTSKDPENFWTSGQWMTEKGGGSDVANGTETIAIKQKNGTYHLSGYKWFSSATDSDIALTLAKVIDPNNQTDNNSNKLSMFLLKTRRPDGSLNNIQIVRLKNKLGTRSLPTAELLLDGTEAILLGEEGKGISGISSMLTITRIHNGVGAVGAMRRVTHLARDYANKRSAFGARLADHDLHMDTLAGMELEARGGLVLLFEVIRLLGLTENTKNEVGDDTDFQLLRLLTPIMKLYTAKRTMGVVSEGLECFGGQGYIEDTRLPAILRNAQVTPIWEGTTNVLALDTLRAIAKSKGRALDSFFQNVSQRLSAAKERSPALTSAVGKIQEKMGSLFDNLPQLEPSQAMARARLISFAIAEIEIGMLLVEHAAQSGHESDETTAIRWAGKLKDYSTQLKDTARFEAGSSKKLVYDGYSKL